MQHKKGRLCVTTFFPDAMTAEEIITLIDKALRSPTKMVEFQGPRIVIKDKLFGNIYTKVVMESDGTIVSAFPIKKIK